MCVSFLGGETFKWLPVNICCKVWHSHPLGHALHGDNLREIQLLRGCGCCGIVWPWVLHRQQYRLRQQDSNNLSDDVLRRGALSGIAKYWTLDIGFTSDIDSQYLVLVDRFSPSVRHCIVTICSAIWLLQDSGYCEHCQPVVTLPHCIELGHCWATGHVLRSPGTKLKCRHAYNLQSRFFNNRLCPTYLPSDFVGTFFKTKGEKSFVGAIISCQTSLKCNQETKDPNICPESGVFPDFVWANL